MAIKIDNDLLTELGLAPLPEAEKNSLLKHIYETLEMRVGMRLADQMTNEQLDEFEQYFEAKDDAGAFKWLETNFPNYKDIVQEEFEKLKTEVGQTAPQILAASQQQALQNPAPVAPAQPSQPPLPAAPQPAQYQQPQPSYQPPAAPVSVQPYATPPQPPAAPYQDPTVTAQPLVAPSSPQAPPQPPQQSYSQYPNQQPPAGPQQPQQ